MQNEYLHHNNLSQRSAVNSSRDYFLQCSSKSSNDPFKTKIGVKTLSIIDTISELAQNETLTLAQLSPPVHKKTTTSTPIVSSSSSSSNNISSSSKSDLSPISSVTSSASGNFINGKNHLQSPKKKREEGPSRNIIKETSSKGGMRNGVGHTPDWIREIFDYVRKGNLDNLTTSLQGLESTLIRNITDHAGNNLIHGACLYGHVRLLPFLAQKFGPLDFNGSLSDVNSRGLTPATLAIKLGSSEIVEWLVRQSTASNILLGGRGLSSNGNNNAGDEVGRGTPNGGSSNHGQHSLLHAAAKYGQNELVSWLSDEMIRNEADVDQLDKNGNSPLHVAAKNGNVSTLSTLLHHGANVYLKNDLGLRAADVARISPKGLDAAEFLLLYETSLGVSKEYLTSSQQEENVSTELRDLKTHFKDVLNVSKKLIKERHDICKEFSRILESLKDLQRNITSQLSDTEKRNINNNNTTIDTKKLSETIETSVGSIRDKWSHSQRTWFSANNSADFEHKILKAEEGWSKINKSSESACTKTSSTSSTTSSTSSQDNRYPQRHLRDRLEEIRSSNNTFTSLKIKEHRKLIESEDDYDYEDDGIVDYLSPDESKPGVRQRKKLPTPPTSLNGSMEEKELSDYLPMGNKISFDDNKRRKRRSREEELRQKLKECALSSESAAVIEVIEPTSSEEEEFKKSMMEMNISWGRLVNGRKQAGTTSFRGGKYSQKDLSPTKKLLEMGISASSLASPTNVEYLSDRIEETNSSAGSSNRSSINIVFTPAPPEEHILPDKLDNEDTIKQKKKKAWYEVVSEDETEVPEVDFPC
ncbi:unnamed protein product [Lepeophtheirus salmonis]|uniref:(salmon louse) hypothetical protein n=1 Tax=Lepeophtheirus salmonis TaxID=72036 RepID=A0A7R8CZ21_LEPSM|nr:unnamed protein product [Lepeophtheirus salmonis]CAF2972292.1 unnamed protein product [Lepeophtheirus salmonis]